jgi:hypothetical protein
MIWFIVFWIVRWALQAYARMGESSVKFFKFPTQFSGVLSVIKTPFRAVCATSAGNYVWLVCSLWRVMFVGVLDTFGNIVFNCNYILLVTVCTVMWMLDATQLSVIFMDVIPGLLSGRYSYREVRVVCRLFVSACNNVFVAALSIQFGVMSLFSLFLSLFFFVASWPLGGIFGKLCLVYVHALNFALHCDFVVFGKNLYYHFFQLGWNDMYNVFKRILELKPLYADVDWYYWFFACDARVCLGYRLPWWYKARHPFQSRLFRRPFLPFSNDGMVFVDGIRNPCHEIGLPAALFGTVYSHIPLAGYSSRTELGGVYHHVWWRTVRIAVDTGADFQSGCCLMATVSSDPFAFFLGEDSFPPGCYLYSGMYPLFFFPASVQVIYTCLGFCVPHVGPVQKLLVGSQRGMFSYPALYNRRLFSAGPYRGELDPVTGLPDYRFLAVSDHPFSSVVSRWNDAASAVVRLQSRLLFSGARFPLYFFPRLDDDGEVVDNSHRLPPYLDYCHPDYEFDYDADDGDWRSYISCDTCAGRAVWRDGKYWYGDSRDERNYYTDTDEGEDADEDCEVPPPDVCDGFVCSDGDEVNPEVVPHIRLNEHFSAISGKDEVLVDGLAGLYDALDQAVLALAATGVDGVELMRLCGVMGSMLRSRFDPVAMATALLSAYPALCMRFFSEVLSTLHDCAYSVRDLVVAMVSDDPVVESEPVLPEVFVAIAAPVPCDNTFISLAKSLRKEFVGRLLLDHVVGSFLTPDTLLGFWVKRLSPFDSSPVSFLEGLLASCVRVISHVRFYIDGDLDRYLRSLDVESAALYKFAQLELYLTENGYDEQLLAWIDGEIPVFEKLLPKLTSVKTSFNQINAALSTLRMWRSQCFAKLNAGNLPFVLMVAGIERAGKSEFVEDLRILPAARKRVPIGRINVARPRSSDAYDTEINPNTDIILFQDCFKDAVPAERRQMLNFFFEIAGGQAIPLTKAKLEEKGTYAAPPSLIMITTNDATMCLDPYGKVFDNHPALAARSQYGMWCTWDANPDTDPQRLRVKWYIGAFNPDHYRDHAGSRPFLITPDKPWTGGPFTRVEATARLQMIYNAHEDANERFAEERRVRSVQCDQCFNYVSGCVCDVRAISGPVPMDLALSFGVLGYTLMAYVAVRLVETLAYYYLVYATWVGALDSRDRLLVWFHARWNTFSDGQRARMPLVTEYVSRLPTYVRSKVQQLRRLHTLRSLNPNYAIVVAAVVVFGAAYWKWRTSCQKSVLVVASDFLKEVDAKPKAPLVMPGKVVPKNEFSDIEKCCGRVVTVDGAQNFVRLDDHSMFTVSHLVAKPVLSPTSLSFNCPFSGVDKLIPELSTVDRVNDMMLVCLPKRLLFDAPKPKFGVLTPGQKPLYISGYHGEDKLMYRHLIDDFALGTVPLTYVDARGGTSYTVLPGEYVYTRQIYCPGSCGSVLNDGSQIYGIVVAASAFQTVIRLMPPGGCADLRGRDFAPVPPPGMLGLSQLFIARGMDPEPLHPRSHFNRPEVAEHWDYRMTVKDDAHVRARARRTYGPDVELFQSISGVPPESILESTGASGDVEGFDHKVSPMEHFFMRHKAAQSKPSPILDSDPLEEVNLYIDHCVSECPISWRSPLSTEVALYGDEVIKPMAMDKSAGYPQCSKRDLMGRGPSNEILAGAALAAALDSAYDDFIDGVCKPGVFRPFPKQGELLPAAKVRAGMSRIIMNHLGFVQSVVLRRLVLPVLLNVIAARSVFGILVGLSATNPEHVAALARDVQFENPTVLSMDADHRTLDLNQRPRVAGLAFKIVYGVAVRMGYSERELRALRYCFYLWLFPAFVYRGDVWTADGDIWGSGSIGTEVFQSLMTWLLHLIATVLFLRMKLSLDFVPLSLVIAEQSRACVRVYGDDNHRNHYADSVPGEFLSQCALGCGYTLTDNHDKSKPPIPTPNLSILKRTIRRVRYDDRSDLTMPLEITSIVKSLYWPLKAPDGRFDRGIYANSLLNANREVFLHGPEVFKSWHPALLHAWEKLQVAGSPPADWHELLIVYRGGTLETWDSGGQLPI